jgi:hypothetical protein
MTTSTTVQLDDQATETTSAASAPAAIDASIAVGSGERERPASRREAVLATALVALVAAVAVCGHAFPDLLAPAVLTAVLAAIVALDWLLPSGELHAASARLWKR